MILWNEALVLVGLDRGQGFQILKVLGDAAAARLYLE